MGFRLGVLTLALSLVYLETLSAGAPCARELVALYQATHYGKDTNQVKIWTPQTEIHFYESLSRAKIIVVAVDHDGTFKEHEINSELVRPNAFEMELLRKVGGHPKIDFAFITGRPMDWFYERYGELQGIWIAANHGVVEKWKNDHRILPLEDLPDHWKKSETFLEQYRAMIPGSRIEYKLGFVFHWKEAENSGAEVLARADAQAKELYAILNTEFAGQPVRLVWSDKGRYFEVLPDDVRMGKGEALMRLLTKKLGSDFHSTADVVLITAGDESSDNEMHSVARMLGQRHGWRTFSIKVGRNQLESTTAEFWVESPADFQGILRRIAPQ